jgi:hypothetical protein
VAAERTEAQRPRRQDDRAAAGGIVLMWYSRNFRT